MPVNFSAADPASLHPIAGVRIGTVEAGVRKKNRKDVTLFLLDEGTSVGGVFTSNRFCAAPVQICQKQLTVRSCLKISALPLQKAIRWHWSAAMARLKLL